ncbi:MAG: CPBP family glutamic-type intramembrane protease [Acidobacteriota bacterium]
MTREPEGPLEGEGLPQAGGEDGTSQDAGTSRSGQGSGKAETDGEDPPSPSVSAVSDPGAASKTASVRRRRSSRLARVGRQVYLPMAVVGLAIMIFREGVSALPGRLFGAHPFRDLSLGLLAGATLAGIWAGLSRAWPVAARLDEVLGSALGPLRARDCAGLAAWSGVGEELLFRGALLPWLGLWPSSLLFGIVHLPLRRELVLWPILAAALGLLFGKVFLVTGAVAAPVAMHAGVNLVGLLRLAHRGEAQP